MEDVIGRSTERNHEYHPFLQSCIEIGYNCASETISVLLVIDTTSPLYGNVLIACTGEEMTPHLSHPSFTHLFQEAVNFLQEEHKSPPNFLWEIGNPIKWEEEE